MYKFFLHSKLLLLSFILCTMTPYSAHAEKTPKLLTHHDFMSIIFSKNLHQRQSILDNLEQHWDESYIPMVLEVAQFSPDPTTYNMLFTLLEAKTGQSHGDEVNDWYEWLWNQPEHKHPNYANFKRDLYRNIDQRFSKYFNDKRHSDIRLDEVRWGGVVQDGIPPLRSPHMIPASKADYLEDDNIIFGLSINGDVRAYPKRIMAWHEMFVDTIAGENVAGVYCTLCGTMVLYKTEFNGKNHKLGTSGFLYRSNKLMYDKKTHSLWNTIWGTPVIGPLTGKNIQLERLSIVTTTWGEWRKRHPNTKVLSLRTGHRRDYGEGVAYQDYFGTDELMFNVPTIDTRLDNKAEILALRFDEHPGKTVAISAEFLEDNPLYYYNFEGKNLVILTDASGANRVYDAQDHQFTTWDQHLTATDNTGKAWAVSEDALTSNDGKTILKRQPAHRAFWFGWYAAYPETELIE